MVDNHSNTVWHKQVKEAKAGRFQNLSEAQNYHQSVHANDGNLKLKNVIEIEHIIKNASGKTLDVGTGNGRISIPLCDAGCDVTATDISDSMLKVAQQAAGDRKMCWQVADVENLPFKDNEFDTVVSANVLLHIPQWKEAVREFLRVTKPGGRIVFDLRSADMLVKANSGTNKYSTAAHPNDPQGYFSEIGLDDILSFLKENGYQLDSLIPHNIFNSNFWLEDYLGTKWPEFSEQFKNYMLNSPAAFEMWCFVERYLVPRLPLDFFYGYLIVLRKDASGANSYPKSLKQYKNKSITGFIQECLGNDYNDFVRQLQEHAKNSSECVQFWDFLAQEVLCKIDPGFSPDDLLGDTRAKLGLKSFQYKKADTGLFHKIISRLVSTNKN